MTVDNKKPSQSVGLQNWSECGLGALSNMIRGDIHNYYSPVNGALISRHLIDSESGKVKNLLRPMYNNFLIGINQKESSFY